MKFLLILGALSASLPSLSAAQCTGEDPLAPNHSCAMAYVTSPTITYLPSLSAIPGNQDYFRFTVEPGETLNATTFFSHSQGDIDILLYGDAAGAGTCTTFLDSSTSVSNDESVSWTNTGAVAVQAVLRVSNLSNVACTGYDLEFNVGTCPGDDIYAGNSSCFTPEVLSSDGGFLPSLASLDGVDDYFQVELPDGATLNVDIDFLHADADLDLTFSDSTVYQCNNQLSSSASVTNGESLTYTNQAGFSMLISIGVEFYGSSAGNACAPYSLTWEVMENPCVSDDVLSPNHSCATATGYSAPIFEMSGLMALPGKSDFFSIPAFYDLEVLYARVEFDHGQGDIDLRLWREDGNPGECMLSGPVATSGSINDFESVKRTTGLDNHVLEVFLYQGVGSCTEYSITIFRAVGDTPLGASMCDASINSTGWWPNLEASGSDNVADNDFTLSADGLPNQSFGFYLNSTGFGQFSPPGSAGQVCIGSGGIGRFVRPGEIQSSGTTGYTELSVDLTDLPRPNGTATVMAGEGWAFQYWYRDLGSSNFTNAVMVWFE
jgi:hypothetical protein